MKQNERYIYCQPRRSICKEIAKKLKLPLGTVKKILGEEKEEILEFTDSQLDVLARQYAVLKVEQSQ